ncbi:hypothetical protein Lsha_0472 [Legionella shakespearei DSM 23087]|uniref:Uncharacterized protein n=1 Tax=Legionella shakespearei DSM 23087 TaxID=1122169 RepID=A0A0W0Z826_9GAMM|nr:hypothetical protein Lsha_0472 [Legionella shakespearei DSM 23087]
MASWFDTLCFHNARDVLQKNVYFKLECVPFRLVRSGLNGTYLRFLILFVARSACSRELTIVTQPKF